MNPQTLELLEQALHLPEADRAALAGRLIDSLEHEVDADAETAWSAEVARRLAELDSGQVPPIPWADARRMILETTDEPGRP